MSKDGLQKITIELPNGGTSIVYANMLLSIGDSDGDQIFVMTTKKNVKPYELRDIPHKFFTYLENYVNKNNNCTRYMKENDTKLF